MTIQLLDDLTINQMAAGEVIENTASVIKELVENSLDAHSTSIEIEIQTGGRSYIRVSDNGNGIPFEEAPKAILRHATSKLRNLSDLDSLQTLGFRGEALASIASISKISITTATNSPSGPTPNGTFFVAEGGKIITHVPVFREKGTSIEVKDLFFNTPVRKAFQRSSLFDTQDILKAITHLSLGYLDVAFKLISDQKTILEIYPSTLRERASSMLGTSFASSVEISAVKDGITIKGLLGQPEDHRHNRMGQYLLLNHRPIYSHLISQAIKEGYGHALPEGRHPQFILSLELTPGMIDVNVHPQKKEARFRAKGTLAYTLTTAAQNTLFKQRPSAPSSEFEEPFPVRELSPQKSYFDEQPTYSTTEYVPKESFAKIAWNNCVEKELPWEKPIPKMSQETLFALTAPIPKVIESLKGYLIVDPKTVPALFDPLLSGIGIVDVSAAFLHLFKINELPEAAPIPLLIPIEMESSKSLMAAFEEISPLLKSLGIEATPFGQKSLLIHTHPSGVKEEALFDLVNEVFERWQENLPKKRIEGLSTIFSRRALSLQEGIFLLQKLEKHPPHTSISFLLNHTHLDKLVKGER